MAIAEWVVLSAISSVCENFIGYFVAAGIQAPVVMGPEARF